MNSVSTDCRSFISSYYLLLSYIIFTQAVFLVEKPPQNFVYMGFAKVFYLFPDSSAFYLLFFLATFFLSICGIIYHSFILRIVIFFFYSSLMFLIFSFLGKIYHGLHVWIISSVFMCFVKSNENMVQARNFLVLRMIQMTLLSHYFISGLWKVRSMETLWSLEYFRDVLLDQMAVVILNNWEIHHLVNKYFFQEESILLGVVLGIGFMLTLLFQLTSLVPLFFYRNQHLFIIYGVMALFFHLSIGIFMGIWFFYTAFGVFFFLIWCELQIRGSDTLGSELSYTKASVSS